MISWLRHHTSVLCRELLLFITLATVIFRRIMQKVLLDAIQLLKSSIFTEVCLMENWLKIFQPLSQIATYDIETGMRTSLLLAIIFLSNHWEMSCLMEILSKLTLYSDVFSQYHQRIVNTGAFQIT